MDNRTFSLALASLWLQALFGAIGLFLLGLASIAAGDLLALTSVLLSCLLVVLLHERQVANMMALLDQRPQPHASTVLRGIWIGSIVVAFVALLLLFA